MENLRNGANMYREAFAKELAEVIQGTAKVSPSEWGETLEAEHSAGGGFLDTKASAVEADTWKRIVNAEVGNSEHKLFGGAQYHRALREFTAAVKHMNGVVVTEEEIANAAGVGDMHDGVNFMRAACVLSLNKAQTTFDPMLQALQFRCTHIMHRLFPLVDGLITDEINQKANRLAISPYSKNQSFRNVVQQIYNKFINEQMDWCLEKCKDDLRGMTRFVTWDIDGKGGSSSLYGSLPTPKSMVEIYNTAVENKVEEEGNTHKQPLSSSLWRWRKKQLVDVPRTSLESRVLSQDWKLTTGRGGVDVIRGGDQLNPLPQGEQVVAEGNTEVMSDSLPASNAKQCQCQSVGIYMHVYS